MQAEAEVVLGIQVLVVPQQVVAERAPAIGAGRGAPVVGVTEFPQEVPAAAPMDSAVVAVAAAMAPVARAARESSSSDTSHFSPPFWGL